MMRAAAMLVLAISLGGAPAAADQPAPYARIVSINVEGGKWVITMNRGSDQGIAVGWRGHLQKRDGGGTLPHSYFSIFRVSRHMCFARVALSPDQLSGADLRAYLEEDDDARILRVWARGHRSLIEIDRGSDQGIKAGETGHLDEPDGTEVPDGELTILSVTKSTSRAKVAVDAATARDGDFRVIFDPPPPHD
jgi:hypothetical protein